MIRSRMLMAIFTAGLLLSLSGAAAAQEAAPAVQVEVNPNSPGWITVYWQHTGEEPEGFWVQREEPAFTWGYEVPAGMHTDKELQADTLYQYRVCAVYADEPECSDWVPGRTRPPQAPPVHHPKPSPTVTKHETYHEPSRIRIWWKKTGDYERVIVRWRHKTSAGALQADVDTSAREGSYDVLTPVPGTYVFLLKGCTLNFVGAANCGEWSAPFEFDTATPGVARVDCIPGTLKSGSPRFAANGRAEYHFGNPPAGYNTAAGACMGPDRGVVASYVVHGLWNPIAKPGAWDNSGANTTETFTLTMWPEFSPERAPRQPDVFDSSTTVSFLTRAHCDRDPWLNANAVCRRTGDNVPQDIRAKWPTLLTEPFPHSRNSIPMAERGQLLSRYHQVTGQLVGEARAPTNPKALEPVKPLPAQTIQGQASRTIETAPKATASATRTRTNGQSAQQRQSRVDPSAPVALNPQPLPPKPELLKPRETVLHAPATQTRSAEVNRNATPLQQSPLSKVPPELAAEAEGKELVELRCRGGDMFNFHRIVQDPAAARLAPRNQPASRRIMISFQLPKKDANGRIPSAGEDGRNLESSQCAFTDREFALGDPPGIMLDQQAAQDSQDVEQYLNNPAHYWTFTVFKTNYGHFRAVRHGPWLPAGAATNVAGAETRGEIPADLFDQDDRAIIIVGGKQTTVGKLKAELRAEMRRESGAPQAVKMTSRAGELQIAGTAAAAPSGVSAKHLAPAVVSQSAIQQTQIATTRNTGGKQFTHSQSQTIAGSASNQAAASLQVDCNAQVPRIVQVRGPVKAGETFTIEGSCFGREPGSVELIGLPSGKVTTPFTSWSEGSIAAMMPPVRGVQDQRLAMTIIRKADRKTSPPREVSFVAAKGVVPVPADRWSPSERFVKSQVRYEVHERDFMGDKTDESGTGRMQPGVAQLRAQINPACALDAMGTTPNSGYVRRILGWENGPPHQADVNIEWAPGCTTRTERSRMSGDRWVTYICEIDFTVNATAYCPVGISP